MKSKIFCALVGSIIIAYSCTSQNNSFEKTDSLHVKSVYDNNKKISTASAQVDSIKIEWKKIINKVKQSKN